MQVFTKSDPRIAALQLATAEMADKTKDLTTELHLAAFTVAIALTLGTRIPEITHGSIETIRRPVNIMCIIKASELFNTDRNFWID